MNIHELKLINPNCNEQPEDFNAEQFTQTANAFLLALSSSFKHQFELDLSIQDSTHGAEIGFPKSLITGIGAVHPCIRISKFCGLYTITMQTRISNETESNVRLIAEKLNYRYVPESIFGVSFEKMNRVDGGLFNQLFDYT